MYRILQKIIVTLCTGMEIKKRILLYTFGNQLQQFPAVHLQNLKLLLILVSQDVFLLHGLILLQELCQINTSITLFYNLAKSVPTFARFHKFPH